MDAEDRRARREARRRAVRRRRLTAVAAVLLAGVAVGAVALASGGSSHGGGGRASDTTASGAAATATSTASRTAPAPSGGATTGGTAPLATAVPILMYHVIAAPPAGAPFPGLYVPADEFAEQMQALQRAGWHAVTMDELRAHWRTGASLGPGTPIVLTFDNGYNSQYTHALPVLRKLGWVGVENIQLSGLPPSQGGLGEGQVRGLLAAGWELDTQGISHADLTALGPAALHYQVAVARTLLRHRYHVAVNWFCYPSGHYDAAVVAAVQAAGYAGSTTVVPGWAHPSDDPYRLHRLRVLGGTSGSQLLAQVTSTRDEGPAPATYTGG
jgi:peptidoglycan/xylan/chitin deacetylase (PgdA/CDA1 family)